MIQDWTLQSMAEELAPANAHFLVPQFLILKTHSVMLHCRSRLRFDHFELKQKAEPKFTFTIGNTNLVRAKANKRTRIECTMRGPLTKRSARNWPFFHV